MILPITGILPADLRKYHCPACHHCLGGTGYQATEAERKELGEHHIDAGDTSACLNCLLPLVFDGKGGARLMTLFEINALPKIDRETLQNFRLMLYSRK